MWDGILLDCNGGFDREGGTLVLIWEGCWFGKRFEKGGLWMMIDFSNCVKSDVTLREKNGM